MMPDAFVSDQDTTDSIGPLLQSVHKVKPGGVAELLEPPLHFRTGSVLGRSNPLRRG